MPDQDPDSFIRSEFVFYGLLGIIINQLKFRFFGMNEIISNVSVIHPASLKNLNGSDFLKKATEFVDLYKKNVYYICKRNSAFGQLSEKVSKTVA